MPGIGEAGSYLPLKRGDLIKLPSGSTRYSQMNSTWGYGECNGVEGEFPMECVYILATMTKPPQSIIVSFFLLNYFLINFL